MARWSWRVWASRRRTVGCDPKTCAAVQRTAAVPSPWPRAGAARSTGIPRGRGRGYVRAEAGAGRGRGLSALARALGRLADRGEGVRRAFFAGRFAGFLGPPRAVIAAWAAAMRATGTRYGE